MRGFTSRFCGWLLAVFVFVLSSGVLLGGGGFLQPAQAQSLFNKSQPADKKIEIPEELDPAAVDQLLGRLSDEQIRVLLRDELVRRADEQAAEEDVSDQTLLLIETRLSNMATEIRQRVTRWSVALANLENRKGIVAARLSLASSGVGGMVLAAIGLVITGVLPALLISWGTRNWRSWLKAVPEHSSYWEKVGRTLVLGGIEVLPIIVFVLMTMAGGEQFTSPLGPLSDQVWIYHTGVSYAWLFVVIARRAFAPEVPQIRIAPLQDEAARHTFALVRRALFIGAGGWVVAGFFPTLGWGFPPAIVTVALTGTLVAGLLLLALIRNYGRVQKAAALLLTPDRLVTLESGPARFAPQQNTVEVKPAAGPDPDPVGGSAPADASSPVSDSSSLGRITVRAAPLLIGGYLLLAWLYWLAHWLERGQQQLEGPIGTLIVALTLPIVDHLGRNVVESLLRGDSERTARFRKVFTDAWRLLSCLGAGIVVLQLWGLDLLGLVKGADAPVWASTGFDIGVTLLLGLLVWKLITAALHSEKRVSDASEDAESEEVSASTRLDTLTPLFRNLLLGFLGVIVIMTVLSSLGIDIAPLIASAGVVGIAVGFGAQTLVKDIFSGVFFLIDDAFRVGEYIELDKETRGEVESISIRSLQLRHHRGAVITIPFGELKKITNHNRDWVIYKMPFRLEPDTDPKKVKKVVKRIGQEFLDDPEHGHKFIEPLKSQGVFSIDDDSALIMRVKFKCKPRAQFVLRREIYHKLRSVFAAEGIAFARRKVEVVSSNGKAVDDPKLIAGIPKDLLEGPETKE
ncbi:mechanosensitive ion channel family protein [Kiloniella laminariae]|uniref:Mechanosensitive ion channel family protein n=1 Tax=Kiloniella laminariae TaxID=454162 RepID=A0ABT4LFL6_9PROT|nr:mechanosensitive ion channel family protein [Kiloniella laminariae]MCZ4279888.1 mechanosensitive ion channel family protein [Kiloniella laminariae]